MKKYLFLFTISPVQAFIAQARKAQDLYAGSKLLSDLIRFAIIEFNKRVSTSGNIIFPANYNDNNAALPNRFLAELEIDENNATDFGEKLEEAVKMEFRKIAQNLFDRYIQNESDKDKIREQFFWQIDNHLIIHWLFEPLEGQTYQQAYENIESNLGAIKNIRRFEQLPVFETGRKDSITGELNALIFNKGGKPKAFTENAIEINVRPVYLSNGEGLSAVSFVKRFYKLDENDSFPSTAEICQYDIKNEIENLNSYKNTLLGNFDFQLLYKENLNKDYFKKHLLKINDGFFDEVKKAFKKLKFPENKKQKKYYAILVFDGDDMGKWLSGQQLGNDTDYDKLKAFHNRFSELLGNFAVEAKRYVDNNNFGRTIYAGGDDFLALLNLNNIFDTLTALRKLFDTKLNQVLKEEFETTVDFTFSAGLAIAHYKSPLGEALTRARVMEHKAKETVNKNALAIAVIKHSGEMLEASVKWGESVTALSVILTYLTDKKFSPAFIENLNREFEIFKTIKLS